MRTICSENRLRRPEKRCSSVTLTVQARGDPHPHAVILAYAAFFLIVDGLLHTVFSANGPHRRHVPNFQRNVAANAPAPRVRLPRSSDSPRQSTIRLRRSAESLRSRSPTPCHSV